MATHTSKNSCKIKVHFYFAANNIRGFCTKIPSYGESIMDIILQGDHSSEEAAQSLARVLELFKERYHIAGFREIHLTVTLIDEQGDDVELVDSESNQAYRIFEVYRQGYELNGRKGTPTLQLIVDNTRPR